MMDEQKFTNKPNVYCSACNLTKKRYSNKYIHAHECKLKYLSQAIDSN